MKYILTEEEWEDLLQKGRRLELENKEKIQVLCTMVADHMPINKPWIKDGSKSPWECILSREDIYDEHYCDCCPVDHLCPYENKNYSK